MAFSLALGVTTESLKAKAGDVSADIADMKANVESMKAEVENTVSYWKGDAGDLQRKQFEEILQDLQKMFDRLDTYPVRILQMAGIYEVAEDNSVAVASSTTADIVMY